MLQLAQSWEGHAEAVFHKTTMSEISNHVRSLQLCYIFGVLSRYICFSQIMVVVSPDLCEAGMNTACDGSRIQLTRVTSQAVRLKLPANWASKFIFSLSFTRYVHTRGANARRFVANIDLMALPEAQAVRPVTRIVAVWTADRRALTSLKAATQLKSTKLRKDSTKRGKSTLSGMAK